MIRVGQLFPAYSLKGVVSADIQNAFVDINQHSHPNKWRVLFFWPKDFTFVCPTEIIEFDSLYNEFNNRNAQLLGVSTDSEFVHLAWKQHNGQLRDIAFPFVSDIKRELSQALGILDANEGVAQRATIIVDPENVVRFLMVTDLNVGRNPNEVLRVLDALQTNQPTPCNWQKGEKTLSA